MHLSAFVVAVTRDRRESIAKCVGLVALLRHSGYIVQPFVVGQGQTALSACRVLQRISGRRVVSLEPWLHAGSTLQHVFWSSCDGFADVAVVLVPDSILDTGTSELPNWYLTADMLAKLNSPVVLCSSVEDSAEDISKAADVLPPSMLLHTTAERSYDAALSGSAAVKLIQQHHPKCRLLGSLPEAALGAAVQTLHSLSQPSAEPLRAIVAAAIKSRTLHDIMAKARPQDRIPKPKQQLPHHLRPGFPRTNVSNRVRIAVGVDMGDEPSQMQGNLTVLESLGCELTNVSMASATCLPPDISGLYLSASLTPGSVQALSSNISMRLSVAAFAAVGGIIYAEEAGFAYLCSSVRVGSETYGMAGVLSNHVILHEEHQALSYVRLRVQPPAVGQEPLLQPNEWVRGIVNTRLEVREEVVTRSLGRAKPITDLKVSRLFEAVLVDIRSQVPSSSESTPYSGADAGHASAGAAQVADGGPSTHHAVDTVPEGYVQGSAAATLVHVCFASQVSAVQPLVAACAATDAREIAEAAAKHISSTHKSSGSGSRSSSARASRVRAPLTQSGSEGCLSQMTHPMVRLTGDHSTTPPSPRCLTPSASAVSIDISGSPVPTASSLPATGMPVSCAAAGLAGSAASDSEIEHVRRAVSHDGPSHMPRPGWVGSGISRWRSIPESLCQVHDGHAGSAGVSAHGSHGASTLRSAAQWWMPPQPLPRVRVLSGRDLTAHEAGMRAAEAHGSRPARCSSDCTAAVLQSSGSGEYRYLHAADAPDQGTLSKHNSSSSVLSLSLQERSGGHTVARQIAALSPSIAEMLHYLGLGNTVAGGPAECLSLKPFRGRNRSNSFRTVISLITELTDATTNAAQKHRRTPSCDGKTCQASWRAVAERVVMGVREWQPSHVLHPDQMMQLSSPMVLTWEAERVLARKRGGVMPVREAADAAVLDSLRHMEVPVDIVTLPAPRSIADMYNTMHCMGSILGAVPAAEGAVDRMRAGMHDLAQRCFSRLGAEPPRRVVVLRSAAPYIVAGGWVPELVQMSGAVYPYVAPGEGAMAVEWADVAAQDPDAIVVVVEIVGVEAASAELHVLAEEPGWWSLRATRNREVFVVDAVHLLRVGPAAVSAADMMAKICRPELRKEHGEGTSSGLLKLEMTAAQRCRPSLLPSFFKPVQW